MSNLNIPSFLRDAVNEMWKCNVNGKWMYPFTDRLKHIKRIE